MSRFFVGIGVVLMLAVSGCAPAQDQKTQETQKTVTLTAGRTVNIHGAALYFGGFPRGPMITLECPGGQHDISELEVGQTTEDICGMRVKLVSYGQSEFNNDTATFEVSW